MARVEVFEGVHDRHVQGEADGECGSGDRGVEFLSPFTDAAYRVRRVNSTSVVPHCDEGGQGWPAWGIGDRLQESCSGASAQQMGRHLESAHYPTPRWAFADRGGCVPTEGIGVVFEIGDAAVVDDSVREGAV